MGKTVLIVTGDNFPDALSVGPLAYGDVDPIFLTNNGELNEDAKSALIGAYWKGCTRALIVGGTSAVNQNTESWLKQNKFAVERFAGNSRYDTNEKFNAYLASQGYSYSNAAVATGENFPDALAASTLCGNKKSVLVLVNGNSSDTSLPSSLINQSDSVHTAFVLGGSSSVSDAIYAKIQELIE